MNVKLFAAMNNRTFSTIKSVKPCCSIYITTYIFGYYLKNEKYCYCSIWQSMLNKNILFVYGNTVEDFDPFVFI